MNRSDAIRASIQVGEIETRYLRAGTGPTVILLDPSPLEPGGGPIFEGLATRYRVVRPTLPTPEPLVPWLISLVDGLGLSRPAILLAGEADDWAELDAGVLEGCREVLGPILRAGEEGEGREGSLDRVSMGMP